MTQKCLCGEIHDISTLEPIIQELIKRSTETRNNAYCPYSNFKVGAGVLCDDNSLYTGCNVENCSFTVGICAERTAYSKAISEGKRRFKAVAVVAYQEKSYTTPCGACRQFMSEFGYINVYVAKPNDPKILVVPLEKLLPYQFTSTDFK